MEDGRELWGWKRDEMFGDEEVVKKKKMKAREREGGLEGKGGWRVETMRT